MLPGRRSSKGHKGKPSVDTAFLELGRKHLLEDFPNPSRQGCPQVDVLRLLAEKPSQVADEIQEHITSCSPCYETYSRFLAKVKAAFSSRPPRPSIEKRRRP